MLYTEIKKYPTLHLVAANTDKDHVHLQIEIPPSIAVAAVVQKLKATTSHLLRTKFRIIKEIYLGKEGIWSVGYFVSSIGLNEAQIKRYIEYQGRQELPQTMRVDTKSNQMCLEFS